MPSKESNTPETNNENVVKFKPSKEKVDKSTKKRNPITLTQITTYAILGLLALVLIVGVFPSFGSGGSSPTSIVFGTYDKAPIEFAYGNYFYRQYQIQAQENKESTDSAAYQVWRAAFENTVFFTAVSQMAEKVGFRVVEESLNQAILEAGVYNKDGKFDAETYKKASVEYKNQINQQYTDNLPVQTVMSDLSTILSSEGEVDYIIQMGNTSRSFDYVVFDASRYPDDLTAAYAVANPSLFTQIDISLISVADEAAANSIREKITTGAISFADAAKENSLDTFAADGGRAGVFYLFELQSNFTDIEQVNLLFSTAAGQVSQAFATPSGYALYQVESAPALADFTDKEVLADVKRYIGSSDAGVVTAYLQEQAAAFAASDVVTQDFTAAAQKEGLSVVTVDATPANVGGSSYLSSFSYTDMGGGLTAVASDAAVMKTLYTLPVGSITEPLAVEGAFLIAKVTGETNQTDENNEYLRMIYPYLSQSQNQQDFIQAVFTSSKLEDNFLTVFLSEIMGVESN